MVNLASGYARLARWTDAIAMAQQALSLARLVDDALARQLAERIRQYKEHQSQAAGSTNAPDKRRVPERPKLLPQGPDRHRRASVR